MNHIDKPDAFDPEQIRRKVSEVRTIAQGVQPDQEDGGKTVELTDVTEKELRAALKKVGLRA